MLVNWVVLTYFVVGVFALIGFYRGWWKEGLTTGFLALLIFLLEQPEYAETLIALVNSAIAIVWTVAPEFFRSLFSDVLAVDVASGRAFQFNPSDPSTWLMLMVFLVCVSIIMGRSSLAEGYAATPAGGVLGGLVGGVNGFILLNLVREYLDGRQLPGSGGLSAAESFNAGSGIASSGVTIQASNLPNFTIMDSIVPWVFIVIGLFVFLMAINNRYGAPKNKIKFWQVTYKDPYGYQKGK